MIIDLTQHHIDDAHRYRDNRMQWCRYCPIALAAQDAGLIAAQVTSTALSFETDAGERRLRGAAAGGSGPVGAVRQGRARRPDRIHGGPGDGVVTAADTEAALSG